MANFNGNFGCSIGVLRFYVGDDWDGGTLPIPDEEAAKIMKRWRK